MSPPVLFIAPTRIGDAVLAASLLAYICRMQDQARVTIIASPYSAPLYAAYPQLAALHVVAKQSYARHWLKIWRIALPHRWDAVWDLRGSALAYLCRTRQRYIFRSTAKPMPKLRQFAQLLGLPQLPLPVLWTSAADDARAREVIAEHEKVIVLAPSANWPPKEWPMEHFITLAHQLFSGAYRGYLPMIVTAPHERDRALPLLHALSAYRPIDATNGALSLLELYACLRRARGFVGNDSGLMHMAAAAGIPTIGLFGPTDAVTYQPQGVKASALHAPGGNLAQLTPEAVAETMIAWKL
jgi:ADP-heptose:LPS heptosyltransferase